MMKEMTAPVSTANEVWEGDGHGRLADFWGAAGTAFPKQRCVASRCVADGFFSALLGCGHVVRAPATLARSAPGGRVGRVGCYKCWLRGRGWTLAAALAGLRPCSFCGAGHDPRISCAKPHAALGYT